MKWLLSFHIRTFCLRWKWS